MLFLQVAYEPNPTYEYSTVKEEENTLNNAFKYMDCQYYHSLSVCRNWFMVERNNVSDLVRVSADRLRKDNKQTAAHLEFWLYIFWINQLLA